MPARQAIHAGQLMILELFYHLLHKNKDSGEAVISTGMKSESDYIPTQIKISNKNLISIGCILAQECDKILGPAAKVTWPKW